MGRRKQIEGNPWITPFEHTVCFPWDEGSEVAEYQPMFDQPVPRLGNKIVGSRIT